ncbi:MAG: CRISPR-associated endonuclease Cas2 [Thermaurantimonas sp.]|uniref:CRISPR-associated endonuclease Cas2 n=1 Tax=Thermaurantimonas sp. TaxID=2681568 RepID=UPI00391B8C34
MSKPRNRPYPLKEKLHKIYQKNLRAHTLNPPEPPDPLQPMDERLRQILKIFNHQLKSTEMIYLIMYDIENDKIRTQIAKYLIRQGCIRIQKSVFIARSDHPKFQDIYTTLQEVNSYYENQDSILLVPVNTSDIRSMKIIGREITLTSIISPPNTLFF